MVKIVNWPLTFMNIPVFNPVAEYDLDVTGQSDVPVADTVNKGGVSPCKRPNVELGIPTNVIALEQSNTTALKVADWNT